MAKPFVRSGILHKSVLEITAEPIVKEGDDPANAPVVATGFLQRPGTANTNWTDADLRSSVKTILRNTTGSVISYDGWIRLAFAGKATVEINILLTMPNGKTRRKKQRITKSTGVDHTTIVITMAK